MANEELSEIIKQLADIGALMEEFSEIASEMKKSADAAVTDLKKEKTDIDEAVKDMTTSSDKWEAKTSALEKSVNETGGRIFALDEKINGFNKLLEEKVSELTGFSNICGAIFEKLESLGQAVENLTNRIEVKESDSDIVARLERIERGFDTLARNNETIVGMLASITEQESGTDNGADE